MSGQLIGFLFLSVCICYVLLRLFCQVCGKHILPVLNTQECQTDKDVIECLKKKYGRTRLEKLEELVPDWMAFRDDDFDDEIE